MLVFFYFLSHAPSPKQDHNSGREVCLNIYWLCENGLVYKRLKIRFQKHKIILCFCISNFSHLQWRKLLADLKKEVNVLSTISTFKKGGQEKEMSETGSGWDKSATTIFQQMFFLFSNDMNPGHRFTIEFDGTKKNLLSIWIWVFDKLLSKY